jgi:LPS-assembly protein
MRRKNVLSHPQHLFPTFPAIAVKVLLPALLPLLSLPAIAQTQSVKVEGKVAPKPDDKNAPTIIQSERTSGRPDRIVNFDDNVELVKGSTVVTADHAVYRNLEDQIDASGNVRVLRNGDCYVGDSMSMGLDSGAGVVINPAYKLLRNNGQGKGEKIDFLDAERSVIHQGTYSTCEGLNPDWYLKADTMSLDTGLDTGRAYGSVVMFKGVPILAAPSAFGLSFPLSSSRHSGLLAPSFGSTTKGGFELGLPYYFNIAPNRDLTVSPKLIQKRGLQMGLDGRYLGTTYAGETKLEFLLNDRQTETNRYALSSIHTQTLMPQLALAWNVNLASDDNYPADFSNSISQTAVRVLPRDVSLAYSGSFWSATLLTSNYLVLQDPLAPIVKPYDRLPQLTLHAGKFDVMGLDWSVDSILTRFSHPTLVNGDREVLQAQVSAPIVQPGYFIVPKISLHASAYQVTDPISRTQTNSQRAVPTFSVDSGLVFERQAKFFGSEMTQTLEPRLFYVNTPYRDQSMLPNFDSAPADFNFAQMFSENRFVGNDRIGDANQLTAALISRYIEVDGAERIKLAIGQRFSFGDQKVTLSAIDRQSRSDLLLAASGRLTDALSVDTGLQISQSDRQSVRANYGLRWQPAPKKLLNVEYRFQRDVLKQIDVSGQWPVADRWYAVGRMNYSILDKKLVEGLAGFEYKQDCWSFRFIAQRFITTSASSNTGFSMQLELSGLGKLGTNTLDALKRGISGYQPIN